MAKEIEVFNHGKNPINLTHIKSSLILGACKEFHFKEDGSVYNKPSITMVHQLANHNAMVYAEMTLETLTECLNELGYEITKNS